MSTTQVKLYVYDLSRGMASALSHQLTGRQINGIWHTSVVVFGKEIFYGQGITITRPGQSHHGQPMQIIDMGETAIDEETFDEYLEDIRVHYTADKYHLLDFNCNSFTNDVVGFLTGGSIPTFIKDLPSDFLSTPFGAALRPTIDAMFRPPVPGQAPVAPTSPAASSLLQSVADQAQAPTTIPSTSPGISSISAPMHVITNPASLNSFLKSHRAAAAFFTSQTCPPCRMIEPIYERLAEEKSLRDGRQGVAFAKVDIGVGLGRSIAAEWSIRSTPTFYFFQDGKKKAELKGADAAELRTQIDLLIYETYPPHPHTRLSLPILQKLSLKPILFSQQPPIDTVVSKLFASIDEASWPATANPTPDQIKNVISKGFVPYLKSIGSPKNTNSVPVISNTAAMLATWSQATSALANALSAEVLFPLVDIWRLAFLDPSTANWAAAPSTTPSGGPIGVVLPKAIDTLQSRSSKGARNFILTVLRLLCNSFSSPMLARRILTDGAVKPMMTSFIVASLLHDDGSVRTAAASLAFNIGAWLQNSRIEAGKGVQGTNAVVEDDEWQVELVSAILEAFGRETSNEEVVHRLAAALGLLIRLSPFYDEQLKPLLEILQARGTLKAKLGQGNGWEGDGGVKKREVRGLIEEIADKLCA
ncbi:hypothetical protein Agabi119p4_7141 [Agaricus bisporus var. burnettii]|uniref:PPPDE domain-containing protein n=1 Tax=Agaricus bisporus var. burnettii TaxID=192524 RepID=A0A8H7EYL8_AGABI|nr:hypothetical protein Agabi119p4_7141 [Agaricus bisporus var. burnettii]